MGNRESINRNTPYMRATPLSRHIHKGSGSLMGCKDEGPVQAHPTTAKGMITTVAIRDSTRSVSLKSPRMISLLARSFDARNGSALDVAALGGFVPPHEA